MCTCFSFSGCSNTEKNKENPPIKESTSSLYKTNSSKTNTTETNSSTVNKKEDKSSISESSKKASEEQTVTTSKMKVRMNYQILCNQEINLWMRHMLYHYNK